MLAIYSSNGHIYKFKLRIQNLYLNLFLIFKKFVKIVIIKIFIGCVKYFWQCLLLYDIERNEEQNRFSLLIFVIIGAFHTIEAYFNILPTPLIEDLVFD